MIPLLQALRPKQWIKNSLIFAAIIFSLNVFDLHLLGRASSAFVLFCFASSAIYLLNDLADRETDRHHPIKRLRAIASGALPARTAAIVALLLLASAGVGGFWLSPNVGWIVIAYVALQIVYTTAGKRMVILDVMLLSFGFVLRAFAGAVAIDVPISHWLLATTFLLALFLACGKRRHELLLLSHDAGSHRAVLGEYSPALLDQMINVVATATLIVYILYTTSKDVTDHFGTNNLIATVPFVLYGLFRYLFLIHQKDRGGDPTITLLTDPPLILDIFLWIASVIAILYSSSLRRL